MGNGIMLELVYILFFFLVFLFNFICKVVNKKSNSVEMYKDGHFLKAYRLIEGCRIYSDIDICLGAYCNKMVPF